MKYAVQRSPTPSSRFLGWVAALLFALSGCAGSVDATVDDASVPPKADAETNKGASDASSSEPDARVTDAVASRADALPADATLERADGVAADAAGGSAGADSLEPIPIEGEDAPPEVARGRADAGAADSAPLRTDAISRRDTSARADALAPDTMVEEPDVEILPCQASMEPATLGRLTPLELKTILDGSEDPYLINVKGTSIPNIPGTDAVLANDVAGIEALVDGNLCADIIIYCRSGSTSQAVGAQLIAKGYLKVRDLEGGITAWTAAGYPTE